MMIIRKPAHKLYFVLLLTALLSFPMINCNNQGSGDSSSDFAVQPDDVTAFEDPEDIITDNLTNFNYSLNGSYDCAQSGTDPCYAIIYAGSNNGVNFVGIAASPDPNDSVHSSKIFIYYEASNIQTGTAIDLSTVNGRISAIENGKRYTVSNPSCDLTISDSDPIYGISLSTSPTLTAEDSTTVDLDLSSLNAYLIGN